MQDQFLETQSIIQKYFRSKYLHFIYPIHRESKRTQNFHYMFCRNVEIAYFSLNKQERLYFDNEFFYPNIKFWWKKSYTEEEFLSLKKSATSNFMRRFYEIH